MSQEVKRANWSRYLKRFNLNNQFRPVVVTVRNGRRQEQPLDNGTPFLGLSLTRQGRRIDGIALYTGWWDPDLVNQPSVIVPQLTKLSETVGADGRVVALEFQAEADVRLRLNFEGEPFPAQAVVERLAYSLYERRGASHGSDVADWLEAEQVVRQVSEPLVS